MADKKIYIKEFSEEIILRRNTRIKRLSIKINAHSGVILCAPYWISESRAIYFLIKNKSWVSKYLKRQQAKLEQFINSHHISLATVSIHFSETEHNIPSIKREKENCIVYIPNLWNNEQRKTFKQDFLVKIIKEEAKVFLPQRLMQLAELHGFKYNRLTLRNQKTRWGSCSFHNNISLNIQLMRLPLYLIDYVIIHELCHTVHKNHSAAFWQLAFEKIGEGLYKCKEDMRNYNI